MSTQAQDNWSIVPNQGSVCRNNCSCRNALENSAFADERLNDFFGDAAPFSLRGASVAESESTMDDILQDLVLNPAGSISGDSQAAVQILMDDFLEDIDSILGATP